MTDIYAKIDDREVDDLYEYIYDIFRNGNYTEGKYVYDFVLRLLSKSGHSYSKILYADILCIDNLELNNIEAIELYKDALNSGEIAAAFNLYVTYYELHQFDLAKKFYDIAKIENFPFAVESEFGDLA